MEVRAKAGEVDLLLPFPVASADLPATAEPVRPQRRFSYMLAATSSRALPAPASGRPGLQEQRLASF
jgi:hypothetical protein